MVKTMDDYMIEAQTLAKTNVENRKEITKKFVDVMKKRKYKRIFIVASGSSYNIASNVRFFMQKYLKMEVKLQWAATFLYYDMESVAEDDLVVFMSQGGHSTNTVAAAKHMKEKKIDAIAFTNWVEAPLKDYVKVVIGYNSTPGDKFVTKGLIMSSLFMMLCTLEAALSLERLTQAEYDYLIGQITKAVMKLPEAREAAIKFYNENKEFLRAMDRVMTVGCGPTYATALETALKLTETYGCPANAYDMEEILHGPAYEIYQNHTIIIVDAENPEIHGRLMEIYEKMHLLTSRVILITTDGSIKGDYVLHIDKGDIEEEIAVLFLIVPFQYISHQVCEDTRVTSIDRRNAKFQREMATKLPGNRF